MRILISLLFSLSGNIRRSDYIYGITYGYLLALVSLATLIRPFDWRLIGSGIDTALVMQFFAAIIGIIGALWILIAVITKRCRTIGIPVWMTALALICPPCALFGLKADTRNFAPTPGISWVDRIFFWVLITISIYAVWWIYRIDIGLRLTLSLLVVFAAIALWFFGKDTGSTQTQKIKYVGLDVWLDLFFVVSIVFFVRIFLLSPFQIIGPSMETTFSGGSVYRNAYGQYGDGEFILVDKMTYRLTHPERGDVVVFSPRIGPTKKYLIKRVIGMPGDTIKIEKGFVWIATSARPETFIQIDESSYIGRNWGKTCVQNCATDQSIFVVPEGRYFLMGDNRLESLDARQCFGDCTSIGEAARYVPLSSISGRVALSLGHFDMFARVLPFPIFGTFRSVVPLRWDDIHNAHTYHELDSISQ